MTHESAPTAEFVALVEDAYEHLYDLVYLRTHPLLEWLGDGDASDKDRAWRLHHLLIDVIDELDPGDQAPPFSREWRRHRLLVLCYVDGLDPDRIASELAIGVRHYYRERKSALQAVAEVLWYDHCTSPPTAAPEQMEGQERIELLRMEAARVGQASRYVQLSEVIEGVLNVVGDLVQEHGVRIVVSATEGGSGVRVDQVILRQILLGLLTEMIAWPETREIYLRTIKEGDSVQIALNSRHGKEPDASTPCPGDQAHDRLFPMLRELAMTQGIALGRAQEDQIVGYLLDFSTVPPRTVLIVDDNEDVLMLFSRYLGESPYRVVHARSTDEALDLARALQPFVITLDIMMPERDGWEALQLLTNQPETRHIPVIVCTVLAAKDLALSLGAAAFLEKPVTEKTLLTILQSFE